MSAAATTAPAFSGELTRPGLGRLTRVELRPAGAGGLEQMFLALTAGETVREAVR